MSEVTLVVYGRPAPQGSKKLGRQLQMIEVSKYVKPWRRDVKDTSEALVLADRTDRFPMDGSLIVDMVFSVTRPASHYRTGRNAHLIKASAPLRPNTMPDLSKLARSTEDALTDAGLWKDDARVVEYGRLAKVYIGEDPDALASPGVLIRVRGLAVVA